MRWLQQLVCAACVCVRVVMHKIAWQRPTYDSCSIIVLSMKSWRHISHFISVLFLHCCGVFWPVASCPYTYNIYTMSSQYEQCEHWTVLKLRDVKEKEERKKNHEPAKWYFIRTLFLLNSCSCWCCWASWEVAHHQQHSYQRISWLEEQRGVKRENKMNAQKEKNAHTRSAQIWSEWITHRMRWHDL